MIRLRIRLLGWPRRALVLTDTPRPDCPRCEGEGGTAYDYGHPETGEYEGTEWDPCPCWNEERRLTLLPLPGRPRWLRWRVLNSWGPSRYSDEPPF
ncbi:hypothetical protein [Streptomyces sp. NPDC020951]|uniref:hypothetical protein n=1 Tax=Streptomyces sp. NPDC020951 TaxID=3365104 RepID=UPI00379FE359